MTALTVHFKMVYSQSWEILFSLNMLSLGDKLYCYGKRLFIAMFRQKVDLVE